MSDTSTVDTAQTLQDILNEVRTLRKEVESFMSMEEDVDDYAHPDRIRDSYSRATAKYPPFHASSQ
jgi:hypothetical protein